MINFSVKKMKKSQEELNQIKKEKTAQQWIPIEDIHKNIIVRKDNALVGILRVQPENLELLSIKETKRKIDALAEGFNGEKESFQIFCIGRPVDLNNYLELLQNKAKAEFDFTRKRLLKGYIKQTAEVASKGEITERRFYIIITKEAGNKAEQELMTRLERIKESISSAGLRSNICNEDELLDVLSLFANPLQASFEKAEVMYSLPPLLVE